MARLPASRSLVLVVCALCAATLLVAGGVRSARAAPTQVTLQLGQYRNANGVLVLVFSGVVASRAAGELVDIVGQDCSSRGFRLITSARLRAGGIFQAENPQAESPWRYTPVASGIVFRARWNEELSSSVPYRTPAPMSVRKVGPRSWRVSTSPPSATVRMGGKIVELQRRTGGTWRTVARARLRFKPRFAGQGGPFNHEVVFTVPQRRWTLRAVLPAQSALPCHLGVVSSTWRS